MTMCVIQTYNTTLSVVNYRQREKCLYWINTPPEKYSITQRNPVILRIPSSKYSCSFHCIHEYSCIWQQQDSYTHVFLLLMHFYLKNPTSNAIWIEIQSKCNFKIHPPSRYVCILKSLEHSAEIQNHFLMLIFYVKSMSQNSSKLISLLNMNGGRKILKFLHCVEMYPKRIHLEEEKMFFLLS